MNVNTYVENLAKLFVATFCIFGYNTTETKYINVFTHRYI